MSVWIRYVCLLLCPLLMIGCQTASPISEITQIELVAPIFPPIVGNSEVLIRVVDENQQPIDNASVRIRGKMNSDMPAVSSAMHSGNEGIYTLPFAWTMGGDWQLTVHADLPNGTQLTEQFDLFVDGDEALCSFVTE